MTKSWKNFYISGIFFHLRVQKVIGKSVSMWKDLHIGFEEVMDWSFETHPYFVTQGSQIQNSREISMLPRIDPLESRPSTHRADVEAKKDSVAGMHIRRDLAEDRDIFQISYP
jgi:hypothetical protein